MSWLQISIYVLITLYVLTVASVVFNVILENRNPVRTLAWIIVLVTVPLIGFLFYLYFGVNYRKKKMFSMKGLGDMKWLQYMSEDQKQLIRKSEFLKKRETVEVRKLMTLLLNNSKALLTRYNQVEILNNGDETFPALFGALEKAKKFIHLEYYIIDEGRLATQLKEILLRKAAEGVEIQELFMTILVLGDYPGNIFVNCRKQVSKYIRSYQCVFTIWLIRQITVTTGKLR